MINRKWNVLMTTALMVGNLYAQDSSFLVRFDLTPSIREYLRSHELDVTGVNYKENHIEAFLNQKELDELLAQKASVHYTLPSTLIAGPDEEYKNPQEIEEFVRDIHARYPDITEIKVIGKTLEGREIHAVKISDNVREDEKEPTVLFNGMHHAREVMTPEVTTDMIEYLTTRYGKDTQVTKWVDSTEIWVLPMFNLDGNNKMWSEDSMWRKNTRNGHGVDINRNYPYAWNTCRGSSASSSAQDYRGAGPGSEPETQAMMNLVAAIKPVFDISYHSYSEIVIYPFGCKPKRTPVSEAVEQIGAEIGKKLDYKAGTAWELLYNVDGGDIDWMYTEHQVIPYVIEVNSTSQGFHPSYSKWRDKTVLRNRAGWQHLLSRLDGPSLQGEVSDKSYSKILIYTAGNPKPAQTYTINPDGTFYIMLNAGTYDFVFEGAKSKRFDRVEIKSKNVINL